MRSFWGVFEGSDLGQTISPPARKLVGSPSNDPLSLMVRKNSRARFESFTVSIHNSSKYLHDLLYMYSLAIFSLQSALSVDWSYPLQRHPPLQTASHTLPQFPHVLV
jgi:hypothetical protein